MSATHRITTRQNGLRVATERMENVRSVAVGFWMGVGSAMEPAEQAGISHLLEHMLFRGTASHSSEEIDQIFDAMGAEINAETDREATSLYTRVLDHHLQRAVEAMGEMVWQPRFEDLAAEREVVLEEIAMYEDDPQDLVFDVLGQAVFGDHPLGRPVIGTAQTVAATDEPRLRAFHTARYVPQRMVVAAAGSVHHEELVELIERALKAARLDGGEAPPLKGAPPRGAPGNYDHTAAQLSHGDALRRVRFLEKDTEQYHVCLGASAIDRHDERRFALRVLEGILGANSSSRLFQEVREKRGLAYSVFSFSNLYAHTGEVGIYVGTRPDNLAEAMATIAGELERFAAEGASDAELERSRENVKGRIGLALESTSARMSRLGSSLLGDLPVMSVEEILDRVDAVKLEDLQELAAELFAPARLSAAGVGASEELFRDALAPFEAVAA